MLLSRGRGGRFGRAAGSGNRRGVRVPASPRVRALIDGFVVRSLEAGTLSVEEARREAYSPLELVIGAPAALPEAVAALRARAGERPA